MCIRYMSDALIFAGISWLRLSYLPSNVEKKKKKKKKKKTDCTSSFCEIFKRILCTHKMSGNLTMDSTNYLEYWQNVRMTLQTQKSKTLWPLRAMNMLMEMKITKAKLGFCDR